MREKDIRLLMEISPDREDLQELMNGVEVQRTQTIKAGRLLWCNSYPIWDTTRRREAQAEMMTRRDTEGTSEAQRNLNARRAADRLHQLVENNFGPDDLIVTCTYPKGEDPEGITRAKRDMRNYVSRIRRLMDRRGAPAPRYIYVTETKLRKWGQTYHHHMILHADITRKEAEELWEQSHGGICNTKVCKRLKEGLLGAGKYLSKQVCGREKSEEYASRHRWCASKGLKAPTPTQADKKMSRRRVERIADAMEREPTVAREQIERCYPGYEVVELKVKTSRWVTGAYIYAVMAKKEWCDDMDTGRRGGGRRGHPDVGRAGGEGG